MSLSTFTKVLVFSISLYMQSRAVFAQEEVLSKIQFPFIEGKLIDSTTWDIPYPKRSCVFDIYYDTASDILYTAGQYRKVQNIDHSCLAAIDMKTGKLLSWSPQISGAKERVYAIVRKGDTIFVAGDFEKVNDIYCPSLAAISASTGNLLNWRPLPDSVIHSLYIYEDKLYVSGSFHNIAATSQNYIGIFDLNTLNLSKWQPIISNTFRVCTDAKIYKNKLYYIGKSYPFPGGLWDESIESIEIGTSNFDSYYFINSFLKIDDYYFNNDILFCSGRQATNGIYKESFAIDINTKKNLPWNPKFYYEHPFWFGIACIFKPYEKSFYAGVQMDPIIIGRDALSSLKRYSMQGTGTVESVIKSYQSFNDTVLLPNTVLFGQLAVGNDKLVVTERIYHYNKYAGDSIHVYCLPLPTPSSFIDFQTNVCTNQKVQYSLSPSKSYSAYNWSYSGTGVTINGTGENVYLNFSATATSGVLSVTGSNECGKASPALTLNIVVNKSPDVQLAISGTITCTQPQVQLTATTPATVSYSWTGPNNFTSTQANTTVTQPGWYYLKIKDITSSCSTTDSVLVKADTAKPKPSISANTYTLTCQQPAILITASSPNKNDSLQWYNLLGNVLNKPLTVTEPGRYILVALSKENGCRTSLSATITSNINYPQLSLPSNIETLTCKITSTSITLTTSTTGVSLNVQDSLGKLYGNPATLTKGGNYTALATNASNGCITKSNVHIPEDRIAPLINLPTHAQELTCSYPYAFVKATTNHDSVDLVWKDPVDSLFANPIFITKTGSYKVTATNIHNGCEAKDEVTATFKNELIISAGNTIKICPNGTATLQSTVTDPYHYAGPLFYNWQPAGGNQASLTVKPQASTTYTLAITSSKGCKGEALVNIEVVKAMQDSLSVTAPCFDNDGSVAIKIKNGQSPYTYWATDTTEVILKPIQTSPVFTNLKGFSDYYFYIKDAMGCIKQTEKVHLGALPQTPVIDFLVSSYLMSRDTFVLVNISNPLPDQVIWQIDSARIIYSDNKQAIVVLNDTTLDASATLLAQYGNCRASKQKSISISPYDSTQIKQEHLKGISSLTLSPNPNNGKFTLNLKLGVKQNFSLIVYDALGINYYQEQVKDSGNYQKEISLTLKPGTYLLKIIATYDVRQKAFIVQ